MNHPMRLRHGLCAAAALVSGCHSYHIDTTVENRAGAAVQLLEVDYPSASFGVDSVASGSDFRYRIQVRGSGQIKLSYTTAKGKPVLIQGPKLVERQQGRLDIILEPDGTAQFVVRLTPPS